MTPRISFVAGAMALALTVISGAENTSAQAELAPGTTAAATAGVNLRAGPGTGHHRVAGIPEGASVEVKECSGDWCEVSYAGTNGFVSATYLSAEAAPAASDEWVLQTTKEFDLRVGPGLEHDAIAVVPQGATVAVEKCQPGWCEVTYEGSTGFIETVAAAPGTAE